MNDVPQQYSALVRGRAFLVHVFTALGAAIALLALIAATRGEWPLMFLLLGAALFVDGIDGMLARAANVSAVVPRWSGDVLDLVVDFTTYVFVPAFVVATAGLMPDGPAVLSALLIAVTGALYFADSNMKTDDNHFLGFPAVWNLIVFYLLLLRPAPWLAVASIVLFAALTFVPVRFVHPFRVRSLRAVTVTLLALWAALATVAVLHDLAPHGSVVACLCLIAAYFLLVGLLPARGNPR
jgi:phosphatidylcholine synthase